MIEIINDFLALRAQTGAFAAGLLFLGLGGAFFADLIVHRRRGVEIEGRVAGFVNKGSDDRPMYFPVVDLIAPGRGALRATADAGGNHANEDLVGRTVRVIYRPDRPEEVRIVSPSRAVVGAVLSLLGLGCLAAFFYIYGATWVAGAIGIAYLSVLSLAFARADVGGTQRAEHAVRQAGVDEGEALVALETIRAAGMRAARFNRVFSPVLALIGVLLLATGAYNAATRADFIANAAPAAGSVVGYERAPLIDFAAPGLSLSVYPVVRFTTAAGASVTVRDDVATRNFRLPIGTKVPVLYDRRDPTRARIDRGWVLWLLPGGLLAFGLLALVSGLAVWLRLRRSAA